MVEHILELYRAGSAIFTFAFLALASRAAEWPFCDSNPTWISGRDLRGGNHRRECDAVEELRGTPDGVVTPFPNLRSVWRLDSQSDAENQLRRLSLPAGDH